MSKWVYTFGNGQAEGDASMRNLLSGKGANLAEMNVVGLPDLQLRLKSAPTTMPTTKPIRPT